MTPDQALPETPLIISLARCTAAKRPNCRYAGPAAPSAASPRGPPLQGFGHISLGRIPKHHSFAKDFTLQNLVNHLFYGLGSLGVHHSTLKIRGPSMAGARHRKEGVRTLKTLSHLKARILRAMLIVHLVICLTVS